MRAPAIQFVNYLRPLGQGGFAIAYLSVDKQDNLLVAKQFSPNPLRLGLRIDRTALDNLRRSFGQEIERHEALVHSNLVRSVGSQLLDGYPTLLVEYLPFCLDRWLGSVGRPKALSLFEAVDIVEQLAVALDYLQTGYHRGVLVHKDVKADNIFVDQNNTVKLGDLGIATLLHQYGNTGLRVAFADMVGPVRAPEGQITTAASDSWALGLLFLHILSGQCPSTDAIAAWNQNPERVQQWIRQRDIPPDALALVQKLLADAAHRLQPIQIRILLTAWRGQEDSPIGRVLRANDRARACIERGEDCIEDAEASGVTDYISRLGAYRQALTETERAIQCRTTEREQCKCIPYWVRLARLRRIVGQVELEQGNRQQAEEEFRSVLDLRNELERMGWVEPWMENEVAIVARTLALLTPDLRERLEFQRRAVVAQWHAAQVCPSPSEIRSLHDDFVTFDNTIEEALVNQPRIVSDEIRQTQIWSQRHVGEMMVCLLDHFSVEPGLVFRGQPTTDYEICALDVNGQPIHCLMSKVYFSVVDEDGNKVEQTELIPQEHILGPQDHGRTWVRVAQALRRGWRIHTERRRLLNVVLHLVGGNEEFVFNQDLVSRRLLATIHDETGKWMFGFQGQVRFFAVDSSGNLQPEVQIDPPEVNLHLEDSGRCTVDISVPDSVPEPYAVVGEVISREGQDVLDDDFVVVRVKQAETSEDFTVVRIH